MKSPIKRYIRNYPYFKVILYKGIFLYSIMTRDKKKKNYENLK